MEWVEWNGWGGECSPHKTFHVVSCRARAAKALETCSTLARVLGRKHIIDLFQTV